MEHLKHIEDLTRRYANIRMGAAGLGSLWASILAIGFIVLLGNYVFTEFAASADADNRLWHFLRSDGLATPNWIKAAAISVSILTWVGITYLQTFIDEHLGAAIPRDPTAKLMRFFVPGFFICILLICVGYNVGQSLAFHDNVTHEYYGKSLFEIMDISAYIGWATITVWAVIWAFTTRDTISRGLATLLTLMFFPIMSSTLNEIDLIVIALSLIGLLMYSALGLYQFFAFMKIRGEINALQVSE